MPPFDSDESDDRDAAASVLQTVVSGTLAAAFSGSSVPLTVVAGCLGLAAGAVVPGQSRRRIRAFLGEIEGRLTALEGDLSKVSEWISSAENQHLLETAAVQATQAFRPERIGCIANVLVRGMTDDELVYDERLAVLRVLDEISDAEVIELHYMAEPSEIGRVSELFKRHERILKPVSREIGMARDRVDRAALKDARQHRLFALGLAEQTESGRSMRATAFGRLVLREIGEWATRVSDPQIDSSE